MMKTSRILVRTGLVAAIAVLLSASIATAQGQGRNRRADHAYDPSSVITLTAIVDEVSTQSGRGGATGTHLILQAEDGPTTVHLGPASFLSEAGLVIDAGDTVTVTGSTTTVDGSQALIAREVRQGDLTVALRNNAGLPEWRGAGPRAAGGGRQLGETAGARRRLGWSGTDDDASPRRGRCQRGRNRADRGPRRINQ